MVSNFARELASYVEGTPDDNGIHQAIRPLNREFVLEIRGTAQKFSPFIRGSKYPYTPPKFLPAEEQEIYADSIDGDDTIYVDDVVGMADK